MTWWRRLFSVEQRPELNHPREALLTANAIDPGDFASKICTFDNSGQQSTVLDAAKTSLGSLPQSTATPLTALMVHKLFADSLTRLLGHPIANIESFLVSNGLLLSVCGSAELLPIQSVEVGLRLPDYSLPGVPSLRDHQGRDIVFNRVTLGNPLSVAKWGDGSSALGAYARGCMFLMSHTIRARVIQDWAWTRTMIMANAVFGLPLEQTPDFIGNTPPPKPVCVFVRCKHITRSFLTGKDLSTFDANSETPPPEFDEWCRRDHEANVAYHEIAGHHIHDLERGQTSLWSEADIPFAEARAMLCECKHGPAPFLGIVAAFNRLDSLGTRSFAGTDVQLFFSSLLGIGSIPGADPALSKAAWQSIAINLSSRKDSELREMAKRGLSTLKPK
ncbi:MAG: hypothetical protein C0404_09530 [Verrucomicrobia bacterium]|nr:hypothetical protein [Verrucomicrobiota bacterium]